MADKPSLAGEVADGVRTIFSRLGEFFHIFDLSFFVAGASTVGALVFLGWRLTAPENQKLGKWLAELPSGWFVSLAFIVACYICGLVVFSLGRAINGGLFRRKVLSNYLGQALSGQQVQGKFVENFQEGKAPDSFPHWRLYIRLWQQLAARHSNSVAFTHLSRYWAMAATYDGVAASLLIWAVAINPLEVFGHRPLGPLPNLGIMVTLVAAALLCFRQGGKYYEFQVEDLVAALAVMKTEVD